MRRILCLIICSFILTGCVSQADFDELEEKYNTLKEENTSLREENDKLHAQIASIKAESKEDSVIKTDDNAAIEETSDYDYMYSFSNGDEVYYWLSEENNYSAVGKFSSVENANTIYILSVSEILIKGKNFSYLAVVGDDNYMVTIRDGVETLNTFPKDCGKGDISIVKFSSEIEDVYDKYGL